MCFFIMLQNHLILHLILLTQPEVTQCYEIVTHYPFRLYNNENSMSGVNEKKVIGVRRRDNS